MAGQTPLFVYGTLMKGMSNHACLREATGAVVRTVPAILHGAELHSFGDYSGMYLTGDHSKSLKGEVLMVTEDSDSTASGSVVPGARWVMGGSGSYDEVMDFCDDMQEYFAEGHPDNVYERKQVEVELESGERVSAWVYECNMSKEAAKEEIESGDFLQHLMDLVPEHESARRVAHAE